MRWPLQFCFLSELSRTLKEADNHGGGGQLPQGMSVLMAPGLSPWPQLALQADCSSPGAIPRISGATVHFLSRTACFALTVLYCPQKGFPSVWPSFEISVMEPKAFMYTGVGGGGRGGHSAGAAVGVPGSQIPDSWSHYTSTTPPNTLIPTPLDLLEGISISKRKEGDSFILE